MDADNPKNVDPAEVAKFNKLAKTWWDVDAEMKPLHQLNPLRLAYIQKYCPLENQKVLDVGCGGGILSESLARAHAIVTGIDMSEAAIAVARQHAEKEKLTIDYQQQTIEAFSEKHPQHFDMITCMELLEHVPDPFSLIKACVRCLKPGGHIFFSTINRNIKSFLKAIIAAEYIAGLLPKGTHDYKKLIRPSELESWASDAKLVLRHLQGVRYHPLSQTFEFSRDVSVNYLAYFQVLKQ